MFAVDAAQGLRQLLVRDPGRVDSRPWDQGSDSVSTLLMALNCALGSGSTRPRWAQRSRGLRDWRVSVGTVMRTIWPFYGALIAAMLLVTYVPAFSLWLPSVELRK